MDRTRIVVTGGAGFVGSNIALSLKRDLGDCEVVAFDNLKRRGSELTLGRLREGGVRFEHGDVRCAEDLAALGPAGWVVECSAEPSVHAGYDGNPAYVLNTNLLGTINCLEYARRFSASMVFLSTSRVYPIASLRAIPLEDRGERLAVPVGAKGTGWSESGIGTDFPLSGSRSIYGATKLASELLIEEYRALYGLKAVINRCGVLTGPWQMGKVDQGVIVLWMARHVFGGPLGYMGFGGHGKQVRDILHVDDLYDLVRLQMADPERFAQGVFNVGGGPGVSISLRELTEYCRRISGREVALGSDPETRGADVPYYVTDNAAITTASGWAPRRGVEMVLGDIHAWLLENRALLAPMFA